MTTFFISDLHLDGARPDITDQFLKFLQGDASHADALYILGDLFETWIGDDDLDPDKVRIQTALHEFTRGIPCYVMHGNRDFLIGKQFCKATGCQLIDDGAYATVHGSRILLMHGDTLCTDDHAYQRLRRIVRNPIVKWFFRSLSLKRRNALAEKIRAGSKAHIDRSMTTERGQIMDVNADAVNNTFKKHGIDLIIHGHTHRPAIHQLNVDNRLVTRIVLGDWYTQGSVLKWNDAGYQLLTLAR